MRAPTIGVVMLLAALAAPAAGQEPFLGEIRMVPYDFAPRGWAFCDGQIIDIAQHAALFSLLGTTFGGDGQTNFALPDLRGRVPVHARAGGTAPARPLGSSGGASTMATVNLIGRSRSYAPGEVASLAGDDARAVAAGGAVDDRMPPYLGMHFIIALEGIYPTRP